MAPRFDAHRRGRPEPEAVRDAAYNFVTCLLREAPELLWRRALYGLVIGDRAIPGLVRGGVALLRRERGVLRDLWPSLVGQAAALAQATRQRHRLSTARPPTAPAWTKRRRVALLAHDIHGEGGMERACLELLERASSQVDFVVISARLDPRVRPLVRWHRIPIPQRPFPLKFAVYYRLAGVRLAFERVDLVHTVGAIVPNKVDVASVHFCHAAFQAAATGVVSHASAPRRANARISHHVALATERWSYRDRRVQTLAPVSRGVADELHSFYPGIDTAVTVNGVDHDRFRPNPDTYHAVRRRLQVATGKCVALFVGGDWDRKGLGVAIRGLAYARRKGAHVTLGSSAPVIAPGSRRSLPMPASPRTSGFWATAATQKSSTKPRTSLCSPRCTRPSAWPRSRPPRVASHSS